MRPKLLLSVNFQSTIFDFKIQIIIIEFFTLVTLVDIKSVWKMNATP